MSSPAYEVTRVVGPGPDEEKPQADESPGKLRRFNMVARDFDWAICSARLSGLETLLVHRARVASWTKATMRKGKGEPIAFRLDLKALAAEVGCERARLSNAQGRLLKMGIFRRRPDGLYAIEKDFRKWVQPDRRAALLNPKTIELARLQNIPEESSACALNGTQRDSEPVPQTAHTCAEKGTQPCPKQHTAVPQRAHGHIEPARVGDLETKETSSDRPPAAAAESRPNPKANSPTPPKALAAPPPTDTDSTSLHPDDVWPEAEVERVVKAATESWDELVAYEVKANYLLYDPECLHRAIVDPVADRDAIKNRVGFIFSRARKYEDMGGPPPEVKVKAKVQPQPKSPLSRLPEYQVVPESIIPKQPACKPGESDEVLRQFGIHVERFAHLRPKERPRRPIPVRDLNRPQAS